MWITGRTLLAQDMVQDLSPLEPPVPAVRENHNSTHTRPPNLTSLEKKRFMDLFSFFFFIYIYFVYVIFETFFHSYFFSLFFKTSRNHALTFTTFTNLFELRRYTHIQDLFLSSISFLLDLDGFTDLPYNRTWLWRNPWTWTSLLQDCSYAWRPSAPTDQVGYGKVSSCTPPTCRRHI